MGREGEPLLLTGLPPKTGCLLKQVPSLLCWTLQYLSLGRQGPLKPSLWPGLICFSSYGFLMDFLDFCNLVTIKLHLLNSKNFGGKFKLKVLFVDSPPNGCPATTTNPWVFSKKMMLVITASASPRFWCLALCWSQLPGFSSFSSFSSSAVLCSDLVRESFCPLPLHYICGSSFIIAIKVLYAGFSQLCVMRLLAHALCPF